eukprot:GFUD01023398.1.p1 GENE.GFUD01023398.1~~GFUD01023398.1.p1  ORF type:complete len:121 (+),score=35.46 GFUD01023398.1:94-456(+)
MEKCLIIAGDGVRLEADRRMLLDASNFFRDSLAPLGQHEKQVIQLPTLDGKMVEWMIKIMKGEVAVDLWAQENRDILAAAEFVGIVPQRALDLSAFRNQFFGDQGWDLNFGGDGRNQARG